MLDWEDLHIFFAVGQAGTLSGAARTLGVDQTTVGRRLEALEKELGARLFHRSRTGLTPTPLGRELLPLVEAMEQPALAVERRARGEDAQLTGRVRVSATEAFAARLLFAHVERFQEQYPGIELELVTSNEVLNLSRREADVAVRVVRPVEPTVVGKKVTELAITAYASARYLEQHGYPSASNKWLGHRVLGYGPEAQRWPEAGWLAAHAAQARVAVRQSSLLGLLAGAVAGAGIALLPCFLGDAELALTRVTQPDPSLQRDVWLVVHRDMQRNAKVRAVLDFLTELLQREAPLLRGEGVRGKELLLSGKGAKAGRAG